MRNFVAPSPLSFKSELCIPGKLWEYSEGNDEGLREKSGTESWRVRYSLLNQQKLKIILFKGTGK